MLYNADGKVNVTQVDGLTWTGLRAADGSINVVVDDSSHYGVRHPCGALRVNSATGVTYYDTTGAIYSNRLYGPGLDPNDLSGGSGPGGVGSPMGLLLTLTYAA